MRVLGAARVWRVVRAAGQRGLELREVRAERARGVRAVHARRAAGAREREHALFEGQLRVRGVPRAAVPLVDAAPVGAQQAARDFDGLGCFQAGHRLELRAQRAAGEVFEQRGGRGRVHAGSGQDPAQVLDQVGAGPGAFFLLGQRDGLLRRAADLELAGDRAARARVCAWAAGAVPHRRRDRRQAHAERARELVRPALVQLRQIQRAMLGVARLEVRRLREMRELALGRLASVLLLEPRGADAQILGDRRAARGEHAHHLPGDAPDLEPVPVITRGPLQAEPARQRLLQVLGHDRGDRADMLVVAQRVRRPPFAVGCRPGGVGDLGVDVQLHVAVPGGVLQPVRHRQVRLAPLAGLPAVDSRAVGTGAGVAGLLLEVAEPGVHGSPDHVVDLGDQAGPVRIAFVVSGLAGQAGVLPQGGVEDRDALGERQGQVEEQGTLAGLLDGLGAELALAFGGGVRLGGEQRLVYLRGLAAAGGRPAQRGAVGGLPLAEEKVIRLTLNPPTLAEAEGLCARAPPAAGRLAAALAGLKVVAGRVFRRAAVHVRPDVVQVIAFAQGRDNCH